MKRVFYQVLFFIVSALLIFHSFSLVVAATPTTPPPGPRYAVCDLCGYCPPNPPPTTWESCRNCIYTNADSNPSVMATLLIDPTTNEAPTPMPGHQYTMLGCIGTNLNSFTTQGAAANVVQKLLDIIFGIVGGIALLYLIYGAFILITSQNEPERINQGKRIVLAAIIGLIFSLSSVFIVNLIANNILRIPGFSSP